jgi:hypothetical protein
MSELKNSELENKPHKVIYVVTFCDDDDASILAAFESKYDADVFADIEYLKLSRLNGRRIEITRTLLITKKIDF